MARVLVTGGTGGLGRELVPRLVAAGHVVRVMSRRAAAGALPAGTEWAEADLTSGAGLDEAVRGVEVVVHAASSAASRTRETDVEGTRRLCEAAARAGVAHLYYVSIVGVDRLTNAYYRAKLAAEVVVEAGGVPFTILRATQFHSLLVEMILPMVRRGPLLFLPGALQFQPIDTGEVAEHIVATLARGPSGRLPDLGGPEVLRLREIARAWRAARGVRVLTVPIPALGSLRGLARGDNCCPDRAVGKLRFADWLARPR